MGSDSERRRAKESSRTRRAQTSGDELWGIVDALEQERKRFVKNRSHNAHVMNQKRITSERHFRERRKEEEGKG